MSNCIEKLPHDCGSGDGLQVFYDEESKAYTAYCFACDTYVPDPYKDQPKGYSPQVNLKSKADIAAEVAGIADYPVMALPDRKLKQSSLDYFSIKIGVSEVDGVTPTLHYYPYTHGIDNICGYKVRLIENKKLWSIGSLKDCDLFGMDKALQAGGKKLFITEGELDAVSLYQVLKDKSKGTQWAELDPAVVSLPHGASSAAKVMNANADLIHRNFKEVILVFDMDAAGKKATEEVLKVFPDAMAADLPAKDANACLMEGRGKALANAVLFKSAKPKNTRLVTSSSLHQQGRKAAEWGLPWPWASLTDLTRGMRFGETYYWGAGVKMGKSELVNTLGAHFIITEGLKVFMAKPEEANVKTHKLLCAKAVGKIFTDPKIPFDEAEYDRGGALIGDSAILVNLYQHLGWETLKADIRSAALDGCKVIIIDPITNLINGIPSGEANTVLQAISQELSAMAMDLDVAIHIFCHLKAPDAGPSHERGGAVMSTQFSGSRAMMRSCNYMIGLEGNKDPDLSEEQRNLRKIVVLEDREFGSVGSVPLYWDRDTSLFNEIKEN